MLKNNYDGEKYIRTSLKSVMNSMWYYLPTGWRKSLSLWILLLQGSTLWPVQESKCPKPVSPLLPRRPSLKKNRTTQQIPRSILLEGVNWRGSTPLVSTRCFKHVNKWTLSKHHYECVGLQLSAPLCIKCIKCAHLSDDLCRPFLIWPEHRDGEILKTFGKVK